MNRRKYLHAVRNIRELRGNKLLVDIYRKNH